MTTESLAVARLVGATSIAHMLGRVHRIDLAPRRARFAARLVVTLAVMLTGVGAVYSRLGDAQATTVVALSLDDLIRLSETVVVATPVRATSRYEGGRIVTYTALEVSLGVAGSVATGATITTRTYGGVVGRIGQLVPGEAALPIGRPALLFMRAPPPDKEPPLHDGRRDSLIVTAMEQGDLPIEQGSDGQLRIASLPMQALVLPRGRVPARQQLSGRLLTEVLSDIRARWASIKRIP